MADINADMSTPRHIVIDELPSTNSKMKELLEGENLPEFTIVQTHYQYAGRGQMGNIWESERNKNLTFSILLNPDFLNIKDQFILSKAVSLAIIKTIHALGINHLCIKWPNDIYYQNFKLAGILIENSIMGHKISNSTVGIGLNVNQVTFSDDLPNATSLKKITGLEYDLIKLLNELVNNLVDSYSLIAATDAESINIEYLDKLYLINQIADFKDDNGFFKGMIQGVDATGKLKIKTKDGLRYYEFKEVEFISPT